MKYYYLLIFIILAAIAFHEIFSANRSKVSLFRLLAFCLVFTTAAFKYETGVDWRIYTELYSGQMPFIEVFDNGFSGLIAFDYEPGYAILSSICLSFSSSIQVLYFVAALLNIILLYKFLTRFTSYPVLALLGYYSFVFFILDMSGLRQSIALNITLFAFQYILDKKFFKYLLLVVLAAQFHRTAYFLIILYPLLRGKGSDVVKYSAVYIVSLIVVLLQLRWIESVATFILSMLSNEAVADDNIIRYIFNAETDSYTSIVKMVVPIAIGVYFYLNRSSLLNDTLGRMIFKGVLVYGIINNMMFELPEMNVRFNSYVIIFLILGFNLIIERAFKLSNKVFFYIVTVLYLFVYSGVYLLEGKGAVAYYPYQNYLIHQLFDIRSTGADRLDEFVNDL